MGTAMALGVASPAAARCSFRRAATSAAAVLLPLPGTPEMPTMCLQRRSRPDALLRLSILFRFDTFHGTFRKTR